jgi:hypothetical protein
MHGCQALHGAAGSHPPRLVFLVCCTVQLPNDRSWCTIMGLTPRSCQQGIHQCLVAGVGQCAPILVVVLLFQKREPLQSSVPALLRGSHPRQCLPQPAGCLQLAVSTVPCTQHVLTIRYPTVPPMLYSTHFAQEQVVLSVHPMQRECNTAADRSAMRHHAGTLATTRSMGHCPRSGAPWSTSPTCAHFSLFLLCLLLS